ncbi:hypothetical protein PHYPO_G00208350 [Pangasianodon hypophthalmus]|uniref:Uncharacterized protein n=1 Tax=Pangasianodon hypophthalmus TaxID=310915 RepID=A0A5N5PC44_PANHP|nr:hypothetical protein PHYPO_G00208350 [Pangasianodon hypophthalmus]
MQEDLVHFIQRKAQEYLQHVDKPGQKEAYFFWQIRELLCDRNGGVILAEVPTLLFKGYGFLRKKRLVGLRSRMAGVFLWHDVYAPLNHNTST